MSAWIEQPVDPSDSSEEREMGSSDNILVKVPNAAERHGWAITNVPRYCSCGKKNDTHHALSCKSEPAYVNFRHNAIRFLLNLGIMFTL